MDEACRLLGVRPQTVYAYVSRGKLEVAPDPADTRRSLYRAEDVAALAVSLASRAARNITGELLNVDGGLVFD